MVSWNWPADFPEDCPPEQAVPANGTYYRIVRNDPPESSDFVSVYHLDRIRASRVIRSGRRTQCETMGLSIYADMNDAVANARRFKNIGDKIARITLRAESGKTLKTDGGYPSHYTWWKEESFEASSSVQVVDSL